MYDNTKCPISVLGIWFSLYLNYMRTCLKKLYRKSIDLITDICLCDHCPCERCACDHCQIFCHISSNFQTLSQSSILSSQARVTSLNSKKFVRVLFCMLLENTDKSLLFWCIDPQRPLICVSYSWAHSPYCRPSECVCYYLGLHGPGRGCACAAGLLALSSL